MTKKALDERAACAKICDESAESWALRERSDLSLPSDRCKQHRLEALYLAHAIRSRSEAEAQRVRHLVTGGDIAEAKRVAATCVRLGIAVSIEHHASEWAFEMSIADHHRLISEGVGYAVTIVEEPHGTA